MGNRKVSRQYEWALRKKREGRCTICGEPRAKGNKTWCERHAAAATATNKAKYRKARGGAIRLSQCSECGGLGHNRQSHFRDVPKGPARGK